MINQDNIRARLRKEWIDGAGIILRDDDHAQDHKDIYEWVINFLDGKINIKEEEYIESLIDISLNFDIPFKATKGTREDFLYLVRMKIDDPNWLELPIRSARNKIK